jgi:hypothetical protein
MREPECDDPSIDTGLISNESADLVGQIGDVNGEAIVAPIKTDPECRLEVWPFGTSGYRLEAPLARPGLDACSDSDA